ncbi:uncharacterized protein LOC109727561 [Ananas comosus]|uniref:Uncharacterized protein LOC109727561 n=1 Tax=Ananas comosus TaxID=4615 RepID=A0A6P5GZN5_ANACO|nr:uncharacterized protein LOC109727561 [Ananas comosus]
MIRRSPNPSRLLCSLRTLTLAPAPPPQHHQLQQRAPVSGTAKGKVSGVYTYNESPVLLWPTCRFLGAPLLSRPFVASPRLAGASVAPTAGGRQRRSHVRDPTVGGRQRLASGGRRAPTCRLASARCAHGRAPWLSLSLSLSPRGGCGSPADGGPLRRSPRLSLSLRERGVRVARSPPLSDPGPHLLLSLIRASPVGCLSGPTLTSSYVQRGGSRFSPQLPQTSGLCHPATVKTLSFWLSLSMNFKEKKMVYPGIWKSLFGSCRFAMSSWLQLALCCSS